MKDFLKKRYKFILAFLALNAAILAYDFKYFHPVSSDHEQFFIPLLLGELLVEIVLIFIYALMKKKNCKIETIFLPLGLLQIFFTPFNQASDEYAHIYRAYDLSKGITTPKKNSEGLVVSDFPVEGADAIYEWWDDHHQYDRSFGQMEKQESGETVEKAYLNTLGYSPITYLPHILGINFARLLNLPFVTQLYFGRIFALLTSAILLFFAIKFLPKYKEFFVLIALLPRTIQSASIFSGDGLINATALLFIALVFRLAFDEKVKKVSIKQFVPILLLGTTFTIVKHYAYFPITLLILLIPAKKFKTKWLKIVPIALIFILSYFGLRLFLPQFTSNTSAGSTIGASNVSNLLKFDKELFAKLSFGSFFGLDFLPRIEHFLGINLGYGGVDTATNFYTIFFIIFFILLLVKNVEEFKMSKFQKLITWAVPILVTCILFYVAMVQWRDYIDHYRGINVSGRYFTPLVSLIPFMFHPKKSYTKEKISVDYVFLFGIFIEACIIYAKIVFNI